MSGPRYTCLCGECCDADLEHITAHLRSVHEVHGIEADDRYEVKRDDGLVSSVVTVRWSFSNGVQVDQTMVMEAAGE